MESTQRAEGARRPASTSSAPRTHSVPSDWFVDPAGPGGWPAEDALEAEASAFLAAHSPEELEAAAPLATVTALVPREAARPAVAEPAVDWGALPGVTVEPAHGELAWQADALCAQTDPEAFFPEKGGSTREAKRICAACDVRAECLDYAMANDERFGIWGGLSERERRRLRRARG